MDTVPEGLHHRLQLPANPRLPAKALGALAPSRNGGIAAGDPDAVTARTEHSKCITIFFPGYGAPRHLVYERTECNLSIPV
jgi:hypothetical protein